MNCRNISGPLVQTGSSCSTRNLLISSKSRLAKYEKLCGSTSQTCIQKSIPERLRLQVSTEFRRQWIGYAWICHLFAWWVPQSLAQALEADDGGSRLRRALLLCGTAWENQIEVPESVPHPSTNRPKSADLQTDILQPAWPIKLHDEDGLRHNSTALVFTATMEYLWLGRTHLALWTTRSTWS